MNEAVCAFCGTFLVPEVEVREGEMLFHLDCYLFYKRRGAVVPSHPARGDRGGDEDRARREGTAASDITMPTLTLTPRAVDALGIIPVDLQEPTLSADAGRLLAALLVSRRFDRSRTIHVSELADGAGFVLTQ